MDVFDESVTGTVCIIVISFFVMNSLRVNYVFKKYLHNSQYFGFVTIFDAVSKFIVVVLYRCFRS